MQSQHFTSLSSTGFLSGKIQGMQTEVDVHITVTEDGDLEVEAIRHAAPNKEIVAELDEHDRRALRDALDQSL